MDLLNERKLILKKRPILWLRVGSSLIKLASALPQLLRYQFLVPNEFLHQYFRF